jgi:transketolase
VGGLSPSTVFHDAAPTRDGYGAGLLLAGDRDPAIVALDCDLAESTRAKWFGDKFPNRFFQMGISEQDMVATAAGLASSGFSPFASSFAIFLERAFEQVRNAVARPNLNVKVVGSHGGIMTGEDGASAQAICDIAIYRALPNMRVVVPSDAIEAREATLALAGSPGPAYLRLTRSKVPLLHGEGSPAFRLGKAETLRDGTDVTIVATGALVAAAVQAADALRGHGLRARVVNMATIKPLDEEAIVKAARETGAVVTCEDHVVAGGLGGAVAEVIATRAPARLHRVGLPDRFAESGTPAQLYEAYGLSSSHIAAAAEAVAKRA